MSRFDIMRVNVAVVSLIALVALIVVLGMRSDPPPPINGDQLGMESGESFDLYAARADESLSTLNDDTAHHFALVTFAGNLTPEQAGAVTESVDRVNAMVVAGARPWPLPEPIDGTAREDVYQRELGRIANGLAGIGNIPAPDTLSAVLVWETPEVLRLLDDDPLVAAVEALPADAQWGRFGVSPVTVEG